MTTTDTTTDALRPRPGWATADGRVRLRPVATAASGPQLEHLFAIETVYRFALAFGERDRAVLADCFTDDATFQANIGGEIDTGRYEGRDTIVDWLTSYWPRQSDQRRHFVTNPVVDVLEDGAVEVTSLLTLAASEGARMRLITAGFYRCRLRRDPDGAWRIAEFGAGYDAPY